MAWKVSKYIVLAIGLLLMSLPFFVLIPGFETNWMYKHLSKLNSSTTFYIGVLFIITSALLSFFSITRIKKREMERNTKVESEFNQSGVDKSSDLKDEYFKNRVIKVLVAISIVQLVTIGYLFLHTHSAKEIIDTLFEDESDYLMEKLFPKNESISQYGSSIKLGGSQRYEPEDMLSLLDQKSPIEKAMESMGSSQKDVIEQAMRTLEAGNATSLFQAALNSKDASGNSLMDKALKNMDGAEKVEFYQTIKEMDTELKNNP